MDLWAPALPLSLSLSCKQSCDWVTDVPSVALCPDFPEAQRQHTALLRMHTSLGRLHPTSDHLAMAQPESRPQDSLTGHAQWEPQVSPQTPLIH